MGDDYRDSAEFLDIMSRDAWRAHDRERPAEIIAVEPSAGLRAVLLSRAR